MFAGIDHLGLFVAAGLLLNLTPGPDVLYIVTHALKSGWRAGAVAALGITAGCFVHIAAAAFGVSALLAASGGAFALLKWVGAAYLVYIGWGMLGLHWPGARRPIPAHRAASAGDGPSPVPADAAQLRRDDCLTRVFVQGFWTNALNPKVALFFLAFLPQFIGPDAPHKTAAFLLLGLLFNFNGLWVNLGYAAAAAAISRAVAGGLRRPGTWAGAAGWLERGAGAAFMALGLKLALSDNPVH